MKYALPLLFALSPVATLANEQACQPIDEAQVAALFDRWNADVQTGDPQRVVEKLCSRFDASPHGIQHPTANA